ncbi:MAG TPA: hypothetical protein VN541_10285 [Tepidisphaeraceae bacterium]|nr:hypothetical protein [Tepidisphaeraceae bacterium]
MAMVLRPFSFDRVVSAAEKVRQRLARAAATLQAAGVPFAVAGDHAVAYWVARVDEAAVRNMQDVEVLIRRDDLERAKRAMEAAGFVYRRAAGLDVFLDGPEAKARDAVHIIFANEKVRPHEAIPNPDVTESEPHTHFRVLALEALVRIKLTSFRDKDRVHLRDLIGVGLIDATWPARFPPDLAVRLQSLLDTPEG